MLVRLCHLPRKDELDAGKQRIGDARFAPQRGVFKHEDAPFGLLGGDDVARLEHELPGILEFPQRRSALALRLAGHEVLQHFPQGRHVVFGNLVIVSLPRPSNIVLGVRVVAICFLFRGHNRHDVLHNQWVLAKLPPI
jgi:hypothetical protein